MSDHRFPSGGATPPSEAPREGALGAGPRAFGDIAADARGPLGEALQQIGVFVIGGLFVIGAIAIGLVIVVVGLAAFVAFLTFDILWTLRAAIIGLVFAVVIAKTVGLL